MTDKIQDRLLKASRYEVRRAAADYIDALEAKCGQMEVVMFAQSKQISENERLRAALQEIAVHRADVDGYHFANCIAKAALSDKSQGGDA